MPARSDPYRPHRPIVPELSAGAVLLHPRDSRILLLHEIRENRWSLPKGHVDPGESLATAARREVREETGLARIDLKREIAEISYRFFHRGRRCNVHKTTVFFLARARDDAIDLERFFDAHEWVSIDRALRMVPYDSDRVVVRAARGAIRGGSRRS